MTLQQLPYIVTIVNCGSISEAAKHLFITQPSLSNSVRPSCWSSTTQTKNR